jgi:hypothetical protein
MVPRLLSTRDHPNFSDSQLSEGRLPFGIIAGPVLALSFSGPAVLTFPHFAWDVSQEESYVFRQR